MCSGVTCRRPFWQNDQDSESATAVTRGWNGYLNESQHKKLIREKTILCWDLTPSLPQPVKFLAWMMHGRACKQYIFWSYTTSTFIAMPFDNKSFFMCQCEKEDKRASGFQILHFYWSFSSDMAAKGLNPWPFDHKSGTLPPSHPRAPSVQLGNTTTTTTTTTVQKPV